MSVISLHKLRLVDCHSLPRYYEPGMANLKRYPKSFCSVVRTAFQWLFVWAWGRLMGPAEVFSVQDWMTFFPCRTVKRTTRDNRHIADTAAPEGLSLNVETRCLITSRVTDPLSSLTVSGMRAHLTSTHLAHLGTCAPRVTDETQVSYLNWQCTERMSY